MSSDLLSWIALRRVHAGRVAYVVGCWVDGGYRVPCYLPDTLNELTDAGLVTLTDDGPHSPLRRASLTDAGQARYTALRARHGAHVARAEREAPTPDIRVCGLSSTETPNTARAAITGPALRWARDPHDGRMHALQSVDVLLAESRGYVECRCEHRLPPDVGMEGGPSGPLCLPCVVGAVADVPGPGS